MIGAAKAIIRARVLARFNPCDRQLIRLLTRRRELNSSPSSLKIVSIQGPEYTIVYNSNRGSRVARILQPCGSISTTKYACFRALSEQRFTASRPARSLSGQATTRGANEGSFIQAARRYLWHQSPFSSINSLICPMARVGFSPLGQTSTQFMMLWQRNSL
jgi:hypothetical protein